jgi:SAM-dependent methyltransferase
MVHATADCAIAAPAGQPEKQAMIVVPKVWWTRHGPETFLENVRRILPERGQVLDFGAGRGKYAGKPAMERLIDFRGPGREVTGFDVDEAVRQNPFLDHSAVGDGVAALPFADATFDMIVSLAVFEHVAQAGPTARELARVLKPGGWLCALTPNRWSYMAVGARLVPNRSHKAVLRHLKIRRTSADVFPTFYRMNSPAALRALFPGFEDHSYIYSGTPSYTRGIALLDVAARAWDRGIAGRTIHIFKRKKL